MLQEIHFTVCFIFCNSIKTKIKLKSEKIVEVFDVLTQNSNVCNVYTFFSPGNIEVLVHAFELLLLCFCVLTTVGRRGTSKHSVRVNRVRQPYFDLINVHSSNFRVQPLKRAPHTDKLTFTETCLGFLKGHNR